MGALALLGAAVSAQQPPEPDKAPAAAMERAIAAFEGTWDVDEEYPPGDLLPRGGRGHGTIVWSAGPGRHTLIYQYRSVGPQGEVNALAVLWWDARAGRFGELWCPSHGCRLSSADIRWVGPELVFNDAADVNGRREFSRETWRILGPDANTMTIATGPSRDGLKPFLISHNRRVPQR